jgi:hypothetical protein
VIYVPACTPPRDSILGSHDRKLRDVPVIAVSKVPRQPGAVPGIDIIPELHHEHNWQNYLQWWA